MTCKHANYFRATERRVSIHAFRFLCVSAGRLVNTPCVACHHGDGHVYTPSVLRVPGVTVGWPWTEGTANNERVHSFSGFFAESLYPRPVHLTYQPRICKDGFISIVTRALISLGNAICSTGCWSIIGRCVRACQRYTCSCAEERRP